MSPTNKRQWALYVSLISLRFFGALYSLPGYIHPDEFFQGGQELLFGQQPALLFGDTKGLQHQYAVRNVPWEFEPQNAVRSIVPPTFMTLFPLRVYASIKGVFTSIPEECKIGYGESTVNSFLWTESMNQLSGREILIVPRIFMAMLSLMFLDGSLWLLIFCKHREKLRDKKSKLIPDLRDFVYQHGPPVEVMVLASSWPCLVFGIRPFTNTLEAMCISVLLVTINLDLTQTQEVRESTLLNPICVGVICSIGIFVRFTFAFFAFPAVLLWMLQQMRRSRWLRFITCGLMLGIAFLATSTIFIMVDSQYYSLQTRDSSGGQQDVDMLRYIAPLNAFLYNSKSHNLAEHGLHPRMTHALVNMPMLFGSLAFCWYGSVARRVFSSGHNKTKDHSFENITCHSTILSGLFVLSCAPHQEPRFLLPCLIPLVLLCGKDAACVEKTANDEPQKQSKSAILMCIWIIFNLVLYIFFGWLHQGGLIESFLHTPIIPKQLNSPSVHIYYKTYMPPSFLARGETYTQSESLRHQCSDATSDDISNTCSNNKLQSSNEECIALLPQQNNIILDLQGNDSSVLLNVLQDLLHCPSESEEFLIRLITPLSVMTSLVANKQTEQNESFEWQGYYLRKEYAALFVHVSTEDWPEWDGSVARFLGQLQLAVYEVSCEVDV